MNPRWRTHQCRRSKGFQFSLHTSPHHPPHYSTARHFKTIGRATTATGTMQLIRSHPAGRKGSREQVLFARASSGILFTSLPSSPSPSPSLAENRRDIKITRKPSKSPAKQDLSTVSTQSFEQNNPRRARVAATLPTMSQDS